MRIYSNDEVDNRWFCFVFLSVFFVDHFLVMSLLYRLQTTAGRWPMNDSINIYAKWYKNLFKGALLFCRPWSLFQCTLVVLIILNFLNSLERSSVWSRAANIQEISIQDYTLNSGCYMQYGEMVRAFLRLQHAQAYNVVSVYALTEPESGSRAIVQCLLCTILAHYSSQAKSSQRAMKNSCADAVF